MVSIFFWYKISRGVLEFLYTIYGCFYPNRGFWRLALLDVQCYICNRKRVRSFSDKILYTDYG